MKRIFLIILSAILAVAVLPAEDLEADNAVTSTAIEYQGHNVKIAGTWALSDLAEPVFFSGKTYSQALELAAGSTLEIEDSSDDGLNLLVVSTDTEPAISSPGSNFSLQDYGNGQYVIDLEKQNGYVELQIDSDMLVLDFMDSLA